MLIDWSLIALIYNKYKLSRTRAVVMWSKCYGYLPVRHICTHVLRAQFTSWIQYVIVRDLQSFSKRFVESYLIFNEHLCIYDTLQPILLSVDPRFFFPCIPKKRRLSCLTLIPDAPPLLHPGESEHLRMQTRQSGRVSIIFGVYLMRFARIIDCMRTFSWTMFHARTLVHEPPTMKQQSGLAAIRNSHDLNSIGATAHVVSHLYTRVFMPAQPRRLNCINLHKCLWFYRHVKRYRWYVNLISCCWFLVLG